VIAEFNSTGNLDAAVQPASITASSHGGVNAFLPDGRYLSSTGVAATLQDQDLVWQSEMLRYDPPHHPPENLLSYKDEVRGGSLESLAIPQTPTTRVERIQQL
jgi:hypothetical protein